MPKMAATAPAGHLFDDVLIAFPGEMNLVIQLERVRACRGTWIPAFRRANDCHVCDAFRAQSLTFSADGVPVSTMDCATHVDLLCNVGEAAETSWLTCERQLAVRINDLEFFLTPM